MKRELGYYWVKLQQFDADMHVAKWTGKYWLLHGETFALPDTTFYHILPEKLQPDLSQYL
jgi:hypothetical protein